jgi:hypothetical protein
LFRSAGEADSSFCKSWVKVGAATAQPHDAVSPKALRPTRLSTQVHGLKQRADYITIGAACLTLERVNSGILV